jgi:hypothetical protein
MTKAGKAKSLRWSLIRGEGGLRGGMNEGLFRNDNVRGVVVEGQCAKVYNFGRKDEDANYSNTINHGIFCS